MIDVPPADFENLAAMDAKTKKCVPILDLQREYRFLREAIDSRVKQAFEHQTWILGPEVAEFEQEFARYINVPFAVGTSSGTEALLLALRALALAQKGEEYWSADDEIVTTSLSFTATGDTILRARATPVFLDIDPRTFNIDLDQLERYLNLSSRVKAVVVVHLYGQCVDMTRLNELLSSRGIPLIEDIAQACGAGWQGIRCGALGDIGAFSFFPSKNLGAFGDAGMVTTSNPKLAELMRILTKHGGKDKYDVQHIGYNARLDTLQAAILLAKLPYLELFNKKRQQIAKFYSQELKNISLISVPSEEGCNHVYHQYTIRVANGLRDPLKQYLESRGVSTMVYYPVPLPCMKVFAGTSRVPFSYEKAQQAALEVLSLPIEPLLEQDELELVVTSIRDFFSAR